MKKRRVAFLLMTVFLAGYCSIACDKTSSPTKAVITSLTSATESAVSTTGENTTTTVEETPEVTESTTAMEIINGVPHKDPRVLSKDYTNTLDKLDFIKECLLENKAYYETLDNNAEDTWCYVLKDNHEQSGSYEYFPIADYNGIYVDKNAKDDDKVIYLTFDCGYPSSRTPHILDMLKEHNVKANFFVTKMYLEECSDYCIRMKQEGHAVCNHTVSHKDLTVLSHEEIVNEIMDVAEFYYEKTGYEFDPYFRTPTGSYTKRLMTIINDAGYKTVFWSFAVYDYDQNNQPDPADVLAQFKKRHHNGAIVLLHNDSSGDEAALDSVLSYLQGEGYRFALLNELDQ
ncbi:MAG: polysaccharide deacetylase family protein [Clostridiales bacterium]|nr:polysaccharide deacetylase family protein [Clostridiales bacterium]